MESKKSKDQLLDAFLDENPNPLVFTLGSAAVQNPGQFYEMSLSVSEKLERPALLIGGTGSTIKHSDTQLSISYADYGKVFSKASVIVHQGGVGTTAQVLRAGKPSLFVPHGLDQPDNAFRLHKRGAALSIPFSKLNPLKMMNAISELINNTNYSTSSKDLQKRVLEENGLELAVQKEKDFLVS